MVSVRAGGMDASGRILSAVLQPEAIVLKVESVDVIDAELDAEAGSDTSTPDERRTRGWSWRGGDLAEWEESASTECTPKGCVVIVRRVPLAWVRAESSGAGRAVDVIPVA